jgi:subtilisin family serine protease
VSILNKFICHITPNCDLTKFGKCGKPRSLHKYVIIETDLSKKELKKVNGVNDVYDDCSVNCIGTQESPPNRAIVSLSEGILPTAIGAPYTFTRTGQGVDVYLIDSGVRLDHADLQGKVQTLYTYDGKDYGEPISRWHGTAVASQIVGVLGSAKNVSVKSLRFDYFVSGFIKAADVLLADHKLKS